MFVVFWSDYSCVSNIKEVEENRREEKQQKKRGSRRGRGTSQQQKAEEAKAEEEEGEEETTTLTRTNTRTITGNERQEKMARGNICNKVIKKKTNWRGEEAEQQTQKKIEATLANCC